jgi:hypothetical protein
MPTIAAHAQASVRSLRHLSATRLRAKSGRARLPALRRGSRRDSHPCSAPGHASWDVDSARREHHARRKPAGVTRPLLSQSSDSTSRLGRNTEGNDAQSRPGAGCKPARRHRTRSASESALAKASLDERDWNNVTENRTAVKRDTVIVTISVNPSVRESDILPTENH